jgi:hypothetical protein
MNLTVPYPDCCAWLDFGMYEIIKRFNLEPRCNKKQFEFFSRRGVKIPDSYCFTKKNTNRYFKKHLGFTYQWITLDMNNGVRLSVIDRNKFLIFKLKYDL